MFPRRKRAPDEGTGELAEINVTPFIDVMLVLLIVFMVAAPLSTVDVPVRLPASRATAAARPPEPLWLTLTLERQLLLDGTPVTEEALAGALDTRTGAARETLVFLRADGALAYDDLMHALDLLRLAGYLNVALVGLEGGA